MGRYQDNPLRPRSVRRPKRPISRSELQRYGLRRIEQVRPLSASKGLMLLLWTAPWLILSRLIGLKGRP